MKPSFFTPFALAILLAMPCSARAGVDKVIRAVVGAAIPKVDSPLLRQLGISPRGIGIEVAPNTPFFSDVTIYGETVTSLEPGDIAIGKVHFEPLVQQVPIAVRFFRNPGHTNYIGVAVRTFQLSVSDASQNLISWVVGTSEIQTPDGSYVQPDAYPIPVTRLETKKAVNQGKWFDIRPEINGTTAIQLVNNNLFTATIFLPGLEPNEMRPGDIRCIFVPNISTLSYQTTIKVSFTQKVAVSKEVVTSFLMGFWDYPLYIPSQGMQTYQFALGPNDIRY